MKLYCKRTPELCEGFTYCMYCNAVVEESNKRKTTIALPTLATWNTQPDHLVIFITVCQKCKESEK